MNICDVSLVLSQFNFETLQSRLNLLKFIERPSIRAGTQRVTEKTYQKVLYVYCSSAGDTFLHSFLEDSFKGRAVIKSDEGPVLSVDSGVNSLIP